MNIEPNTKRKIQWFNVVSASVVILALGIYFAIFSMLSPVSGFNYAPLLGGIGIGLGFSGLYIGLQWEHKTTTNVYLSVALAIVTSALVATVLYLI